MRNNIIKIISMGFIFLFIFSLGTQKVFSASGKPILKKGMEGSYVKNVQRDLKKLGFFKSDLTGYFGDATVTAVRKFQKKYGLPATGVVATLTYNKLDALLKPPAPKRTATKPVIKKPVPSRATDRTVPANGKPVAETSAQISDGLKMGATSDAVLKLQNDLTALGYMKASPTGNFGSITESALIQFQKNFRLEPTGIAASDTLAVVERLIRQKDSTSRGGTDRIPAVCVEPRKDIELQWIPGLPQAPFLKGIGKYEGVVIHFTDNMSDTAQTEADYERVHWGRAFVHEFIDPKEIIQVSDPDYRAWGAGEYGNDRFIHLELCHADNQSDFETSFQLITQRAAEYLYKLQLGVVPAKADGSGSLWSHMDVSQYLGGTDHTDPIAYLAKWGKSWNDVINTVTADYKALSGENTSVQETLTAPDGSAPVPEKSSPASENAIPAVDGSEPAPDNSTPATENAIPAADGSTPAPDNSTPAIENAIPAADGSTPASDNTTPVVENALPAADGSTPAPDDTTPAADSSTPAPDNTTPATNS